MADFTYTTVPGKLKQFFTKLRPTPAPHSNAMKPTPADDKGAWAGAPHCDRSAADKGDL